MKMFNTQGSMSGSNGKSSLVDDFMYGNNVAQSHISIRMGFLRKVYGILSTQLLVTTVIVAAMMWQKETMIPMVKAHPGVILLSFFATFGVLIAMYWKKSETPANYILLFVFTILESLFVGIATLNYKAAVVLEAFFLTAAVVIGLTLYTFQTKRDFSAWGGCLFAALWVLVIGGLMQMFIQSPMLELCLALGGAILFSIFIVVDTWMIIHRVSAEDYIPACIDLYLDIINLFLHILRLVAAANRE